MDDPDFFAELADELYALGDATRIANGIAQTGREAVGCDAAAVSLVAAGRRIQPAAATSRAAHRAEQLQGALGEGPGRVAAAGREIVVADDLAADARWPIWAADVGELGFRSGLTVPLHERGRVFAVLQLYSALPAAFGAEQNAIATLLARRSALALAAVRRTEHLMQAVDARTVIGQAEGMLMERYGLDADAAFAVLRRYSQQGNVKLRDVAERIVRERELPGLSTVAS